MTFLLKILSPKEIPGKRNDWNWHVRCHEWMLRRLLPLYRRSAVCDTIQLGEVQIIHNVRDYWYEQELQRFHIDTAQHVEKRTPPFHLNRKQRRSGLFRWTEALLLFQQGKSYNIKRGKSISIETEMDGILKISAEKDIILRSEFVAKGAERHPQSQENPKVSASFPNVSTPNVEDYRPKQKINIKDTVSPKDTQMNEQNRVSQHQGFEENNAF